MNRLDRKGGHRIDVVHRNGSLMWTIVIKAGTGTRPGHGVMPMSISPSVDSGELKHFSMLPNANSSGTNAVRGQN
jgi:hypothetical protein